MQNWPRWLKLAVVLQVSWLAFLGPMSSAVANPAFVPLSKAFNITTVQASYELTMYIVWAGVGPLLVIPFANIYGRRPIYLLGNLIGAITNIAAGWSPTWAGILVTRAFNGIAAGSPGAIGAATICDLFFMHERGFYMGIFTLFLTNGPHVAPLIGGFVAQYTTWNWCFRIPVGCPTAQNLRDLSIDRISGLHSTRDLRNHFVLFAGDALFPQIHGKPQTSLVCGSPIIPSDSAESQN